MNDQAGGSGHDRWSVRTTGEGVLGLGQDMATTMITVTAPTELPRTSGRAEVVVVDDSASMDRHRKMDAARAAAKAALARIEPDVAFAVVAGHHVARQVWPLAPRSLAIATPDEVDAAIRAVDEIVPVGGTAIGTWLDLARSLLDTADDGDLRHVLLLSDGINEHQERGELALAVDRCRAVLQCDCWGIGVDWDPNELLYIATELGGLVEAVPEIAQRQARDDLVDSFQARIATSQGRAVAGVRLRVAAIRAAQTVDLDQSTPVRRPLTPHGTHATAEPNAVDFPLGGWAPRERRTYYLGITLRPGSLGEPGDDEMRLARLELVLPDDTIAATDAVIVQWSDEPRPPTREVQTHLRYTALADDTLEGLALLRDGDRDAALTLLVRAWETATELGDQDHLDRLERLIDVDPDNGEHQLRPDIDIGDIIRTQTYVTRTVPPPDGGQDSHDDQAVNPAGDTADDAQASDELLDPMECPTPDCGRTIRDRFCEACGYDRLSGS